MVMLLASILTLTACITEGTYIVKFDSNGGSKVRSQTDGS